MPRKKKEKVEEVKEVTVVKTVGLQNLKTAFQQMNERLAEKK